MDSRCYGKPLLVNSDKFRVLNSQANKHRRFNTSANDYLANIENYLSKTTHNLNNQDLNKDLFVFSDDNLDTH